MSKARHLILFLLLLLSVYLIALLAFSYGPLKNKATDLKNVTGLWGYTLERFREAQTVKNPDILFLGSSHTYRGFDTRIFEKQGWSCFNLGSTGQSPYNTYFVLKTYLEKIKPKNVVLEVSWGPMQIENAPEASVDLLCNVPLNRDIAEMVVRSHSPMLYNSLLATIINSSFQPLSAQKSQKDPYDSYIPGGYVETSLTAQANSIQQGLRFPANAQLAPQQLEYLQKCIGLIQSRGINLILTTAPVFPAYLRTITGLSAYTARMEKLSRTYHVPYLDYNSAHAQSRLKLNPETDFYDKNHLSQSGVLVFNKAFIEDIRLLLK